MSEHPTDREPMGISSGFPDGAPPEIADDQIRQLLADAEMQGNRPLAKTCRRALSEPKTAVWEHCRRLCAKALRVQVVPTAASAVTEDRRGTP